MNSLGKRLQHFRLERGWSKRALAEKLGVSIPSIIRWEEEIAVPNDYNRYKIEQFLSSAAEANALLSRDQQEDDGQLALFPKRRGLGQVQ
ncbi:helix-turn-helix transcriptional regulator [Candidatus Bipolaricaulota bacterium]|nr:helix-turn-helix transcriptional regulator [Candidatus Bipolaricaulota bacterium]